MSEPSRSGPPSGLVRVAGVAVATVVGAGFLTGVRTVAAPDPPRAPRVPSSDAAPVPRYAELGARPRGPNAAVAPQGFAVLGAAVPAAAGEGGPAHAAAHAGAVARRADRRAYDGAPPTVPHAVDPRGVPGCLACHATGAVVEGRVARAISHPPYASCLQCHVVEADPRAPLGGGPASAGTLAANDFVGLASTVGGARAWPGAPPTPPHRVGMRERCLSCHGPAGDPGLQTSHPERQSCQQCHPAAASGDPSWPRLGGEPAP